MNYQELLDKLKSVSDENYRAFHRRLLKNEAINVLGVRVPVLRKIAKEFKGDEDTLLGFPDEFYEVTFLKLTAVSRMEYGEFVKRVEGCVALIDNWATCDCFKADCIAKHRDDFYPYINQFLLTDKEFYQRYALTTLLAFYVEKQYIQTIFDCLNRANTKYYYTHMSAAWLLAEVLVKHFDEGVAFLKTCSLDTRTHNKAIVKATESFRISPENKELLKALKR